MRLYVQSLALAIAGCACVAAAVAVTEGGCIVVPPQDLQSPPLRPPRILHDSVMPPENTPLPIWPDLQPLIVPVLVDDPSGNYEYLVFVDRETLMNQVRRQPHPPVIDGMVLLSIYIHPTEQFPPIDTNSCHDIRIIVARSFTQQATPESPGGDSVTWKYPCAIDGAASVAPDGSMDGLAFAPSSDGGDP
jgi:hypothetical protein